MNALIHPRARRAAPHSRVFNAAAELLDALEPRVLLDAQPYFAWPPSLSLTNSAAPIYAPEAPAISGGGFGLESAATDSLINMDDFLADPRFSGIDGAGYSAVILDTGIDRNHSFFGADANANGIADRIVYSYDFADGDSDASDVNGHGSNVSSIVGSSNATYRGMAPGVNLIHLKVFKNNGAGNFGYTESALRWVINNAALYNVVSINMSLGDSQNFNTNQQLYGISDELSALAAMGIATVVAAGNSFASFASAQGLAYPAADPNVFAVGAVYDQNFGGGITYGSGATANTTGADRVTPFSQRTTSMWQIFAPGAPITGANQSGGTVVQHGTSQASPHIAGITVLMQQIADNVLGRRLSLGELRTLFTSTGASIVDGDDENDNVTNTGATFKRVDVEAMASAIYDLAGPEVRLRLGATNLVDGVSTAAFGATPAGTALSRTFTIDNPGSQDLTLSNLQAPAGFRIVSDISDSTLSPGESTSFTVRFDSSSSGVATGDISIDTNDPDEPTFNFAVSATATALGGAVDDGNTGFSATAGWTVSNGAGNGADHRYAAAGTGTRTATWAFSNLIPGEYRVSASWRAGGSRASNAPYTISDLTGTLGTAAVNQRLAPADRTIGGVLYGDLGTFSVTGNRLSVRLTNNADGFVVADAVRIERIGNLETSAPEVHVNYGAAMLIDNTGSLSFGSTPSGVPISRTLVVRNVGDADLNLDDIQVPSGFTITSSPDVSVVPPGSSTSLTIRLDAGAAAAYTGQATIASDDPDEASFRINLSGTVTAVTRIVDDGNAGASSSGVWTTLRAGYSADSRWRAAGSGSAVSSWLFSGLRPGLYRVSASWGGNSTPNLANATNASYAISSAGTLLDTLTANQQTLPTDVRISSAWFKHLGTVRITATSVIVRLSDLADGRVWADAMRIERLDN